MIRKPRGKHARAKERVKVGVFLVPSVLTGVAVAFAVLSYQPLVFDPDSIVATAQAEAAELVSAEAEGERTSAEPTTDADYDASDYGIDATNLVDGIYTGSAYGFKSTITVQVTVAGGKITNIQIVSEGDDAAYFNQARAVISKVLSAQSTSVDTVSGATYSSKGILMAIRNALAQAQGSTSIAGASSVITPDANNRDTGSHDYDTPDTLVDGVYYGSGEGYKSTIQVAVTISGGKITAIQIVDQDDDPEYFSNALAVIDRVLEQQTANVDTVSGATYSSWGILDAVAEALSQAGASDDDGGNGDGDGGNSDDGGGSTDPDNPDDPEEETVNYLDGTYTAYAYCGNTADPSAFKPYYVAVTVTITDGAVASVDNVALAGSSTGGSGDPALGEYDSENDTYLYLAADGNRRITGVLKQLVEEKRAASAVDAVTGATYSSNSIVEAYEAALAQAAAAYDAAQAAQAAQDVLAESVEDAALASDQANSAESGV